MSYDKKCRKYLCENIFVVTFVTQTKQVDFFIVKVGAPKS